MSTLFPKKIQYEDHTGSNTQGEYNEAGDWVPGDKELKTFLGSVQPATGREIESLDVGRQDTGKVKVYSDILLPCSKQGGDEKGAIVYWKNQKWEVITEGINQNDLIPHYKHFAQYYGEVC